MNSVSLATARTSDLFEYYRPLMRILRCPHTGRKLRLVVVEDLLPTLTPEQRTRIPVDMCAAFISDEAKIAYPVLGMICSFLAEHEIGLTEVCGSYSPDGSEAIKRSVAQYYDSFGWQSNEAGVYHDTAAHAAIEGGAYRVYEIETHLGLLECLLGGEFMLDAASGAIAVAEYRAYSWFFNHRVCVDLSYTALQQASRKLGAAGFYVLSDICRLPFCNDAFDGIVSGYTIQHIPFDQQESAVGQLYRVLCPGKFACIVTAYSGHAVRDAWLRLWHVFRPPRTPDTTNKSAEPRLYMATQSLHWWREVGKQLGANLRIKSFRLLSKREFELLCRNSHRLMRLVRSVEMVLGERLAPFAALVRIDIRKPDVRLSSHQRRSRRLRRSL